MRTCMSNTGTKRMLTGSDLEIRLTCKYSLGSDDRSILFAKGSLMGRSWSYGPATPPVVVAPDDTCSAPVWKGFEKAKSATRDFVECLGED